MRTIEQRFHEKYRVDKSGCWLWTASIRPNGYSQFRYSTAKNGHGHRFAYEHFKGPIPPDMTIAHLCRVPHCVNPDHLELVTPRENVMRGDTKARENADKTTCGRGHPLAGDNLYTYPNGRRACRTCARQWRDDHKDELRAYQREYHNKRYSTDPAFAERHRKNAREAMRRRRHPEM